MVSGCYVLVSYIWFFSTSSFLLFSSAQSKIFRSWWIWDLRFLQWVRGLASWRASSSFPFNRSYYDEPRESHFYFPFFSCLRFYDDPSVKTLLLVLKYERYHPVKNDLTICSTIDFLRPTHISVSPSLKGIYLLLSESIEVRCPLEPTFAESPPSLCNNPSGLWDSKSGHSVGWF